MSASTPKATTYRAAAQYVAKGHNRKFGVAQPISPKNVRRNDTAFDGNRCNPRGSIGFAATGANAILQPDLSVYKTAGASLDTLVLDKVDIWANR